MSKNFWGNFLIEIGLSEKPRHRRNDTTRLAKVRSCTTYNAAYDDEAPLVTVIIPTYNRADTILERALPSLQRQTYSNIEVIIVGDEMDVAQAAKLTAVCTSNVRFYNLKKRGSYPMMAEPRWYVAGVKPVNFGLRIARGQWIVHLDDDDELLPTHIERLLALARKRRVEWVHGRVNFIRDDGTLEAVVGEPEPKPGHISRISSLYHAGLKTFRYNQQCWRYGQPGDWDLWERFLQMGVSHAFLEDTVAIHHGSIVPDKFKQAPEVPAESSSETERSDSDRNYQKWFDLKAPSLIEIDGFALRYKKRGGAKRFDLVVQLRDGEQHLLAQTLDCLQRLLVPSWRLVVISDQLAVDEAFNGHPNLAWIQVESFDDGTALSEGFNYLAANSDADYFALLPAGFLIEPHALLMIEDYFSLHTEWELLYTDHDYLDQDLLPRHPQFKPDFDPYYLYSYDYIGQAVIISRNALHYLGGLQAYPEAEVFDFLLRASTDLGTKKVGHLPDPLLHFPERSDDQRHLGYAARKVALEQFIAVRGVKATVGSSLHDEVFHIDFVLSDKPMVSIIIPNRDKIEFLQPCIESLLKRTEYTEYEILVVDNDSHDPDVLQYYRQLECRLGDKFRLLSYPHPFNFSAQVNLGVEAARGEYVVLLNNDTEVIQSNWLERMLSLGQQENVGAVGARLLFPETGKIQHAGVMSGGLPGADTVAHHQFVGMEGNEAGYMNRIWSMQRTMVTAACMLLKKSVYQQVGGFDATNLTVLYNDVDFCLRLEAAGYQCLYQPYASLVHHHGVSITASSISDLKRHLSSLIRDTSEREYMLRTWLPRLAADPSFNRNLDLTSSRCLVSGLPVPWDPNLTHLPKLLANRLVGGSGEYRVAQPLGMLRDLGLIHTAVIPSTKNKGMRLPSPLELLRMGCPGLILQNPITDMHLFYLEAYRKYVPDMKIYVAIDDLLGAVPEKSGVYVYHQRHFRDARSRLRRALRMADRMIVSTQPLADAFADMIDDVVIVPNRLKKADWGDLRKARTPFARRKLRVGWVGAQQHQGDLELIAEVVKQTASEVDWVFMGMWPEGVDEYIKETHVAVPFGDYPAKVSTLNLDIALAPLEDNAFNEAKSNLRLLEYGAMAWSVICSDVYPYRTNNAPVCRVDGSVEQWIAAIRERIANPSLAWREGDELRAWVDKYYWLEEHPQDWLVALT